MSALMTVGELAKLFHAEKVEKGSLTVIPVENWRRGDLWEATGLMWINPSPNMRNLHEALYYPGIGLLETTNISVGRGTDTPFEVLGAPWIDARELARELNALDTGRSDEPSKVLSYLHTVAGRGPETRALLAGTLRLKLSHRITPVRHIATMLVLMGLIGTIVGFIIALSGVNQDAVTDAGAIGPMIATLLHGMAMALFKTLVGSALNLWLMVDYRLLEGGVVHLLTHTIEEAEDRAAL